MDEIHETALVCPDGHVVAASLPWSRRKVHCPECGQAVLERCAGCGADIPGVDPNSAKDWKPDKYCSSCGTIYPWTVKSREAADQLLDMLDGLKPEDRDALKRSLGDLMVDSDRTELAATRVKLIARKAGTEGMGVIRAVVTAMATEAAKRAVLG